MAREHARILTKIWDPDSDFRNLGPSSQRMYFMLMSQRSLNHAGVLPLTVKKWSNLSAGTSIEDVWAELKILDSKRYIVIDEDTEEVLIRTHIRNDGVAKQPNVLKAALRLASGIESRRLRAVLAGELRMLGSEHASRVADELTGTLRETPSEPLSKGSGNPTESNPSRTLPEPFDQNAGEGEGEGEGVTSVSGQVLKKGNRPLERCSKHINNDQPPACRGCRDARIAAENWDSDAKAARSKCRLCDGDGWQFDPGGRHRGVTSIRCDHSPSEPVEAS
jgi:hypothetical protein